MSATGRTLIATFVLGFVLTIGLVAAGTLVVDDGTPEPAELDQSHFEPEHALPVETADGGDITMDSQESSNTVLIHTGGAAAGQVAVEPMPIEDSGENPELSTGTMGGADRSVTPLVSTLIENGHEVEFYAGEIEDGPLAQSLDDADAFVAPGSVSFTAQDRESIDAFTDAGGRFMMTADPGSSGDIAELGGSDGLYTDAGYLYNIAENDNNYLSIYAESTGSSELTDGVDEVVLRSASSVGTTESDAVLETDATLSTTREDGEYDVAAVDGNTALIGDSSFLEPENAQRADNNIFIGNIADFLVTGSAGDFESPGTQPPTEQPPDDEPIEEPIDETEEIPEMNADESE